MRYGRRSRNGSCCLAAFFLVSVLPSVLDVAVAAQESPEILGAPPAFDLSGRDRETIWIDADTGVHRQPAERSPTVTRLAAATELPVLERRGAWVRVRYGSWQGWVPLGGEESAAAESENSETPWWTPVVEPDDELLKLARSHLSEEREISFGPYRLFTDVDDEKLLGRLETVAEQLPAVFEERYGLRVEWGRAAAAEEGETLVLYRLEASYRAYAEAQGNPAAVDSLGHAIGRLAVLSAGERRYEEIRSLLVHELTHVLTYQACGPDLSPWLLEGLAEDLSYSRFSSPGEMLPGTLDGWRSTTTQPYFEPSRGRTRVAILTERGGPTVALENLRRNWRRGERLPLDVLLNLPPSQFMSTGNRQLNYATAAFLLRFFLASESYGEVFRSFLGGLARGDRGDAEELLVALGVSWEELENEFADWLFSSRATRTPKTRTPKTR